VQNEKEIVVSVLPILSDEESYKRYVSEKLKESAEWAANPDAEWISHEKFMEEAWEMVRKIEENEV